MSWNLENYLYFGQFIEQIVVLCVVDVEKSSQQFRYGFSVNLIGPFQLTCQNLSP